MSSAAPATTPQLAAKRIAALRAPTHSFRKAREVRRELNVVCHLATQIDACAAQIPKRRIETALRAGADRTHRT